MKSRNLLLVAGITLLGTGMLHAQDLPEIASPAETLWEVLKAGGLFMVPLAVLSVFVLALVLVDLIMVRRGAVVTGRYMAAAEALLRKSDHLGLLAISNRHSEAIARVMQRVLDFVTKNPKASFVDAKEIAETEGSRQASALQRQIAYLSDIGTLAPMIGLLGTVSGMIRSFSVMAENMGATRPTLLAAGVAEALITTAAGLIVAIPAMAAYAFFRSKAQALISELEGASAQLLAVMASNFERPRRGL